MKGLLSFNVEIDFKGFKSEDDFDDLRMGLEQKIRDFLCDEITSSGDVYSVVSDTDDIQESDAPPVQERTSEEQAIHDAAMQERMIGLKNEYHKLMSCLKRDVISDEDINKVLNDETPSNQ